MALPSRKVCPSELSLTQGLSLSVLCDDAVDISLKVAVTVWKNKPARLRWGEARQSLNFCWAHTNPKILHLSRRSLLRAAYDPADGHPMPARCLANRCNPGWRLPLRLGPLPTNNVQSLIFVSAFRRVRLLPSSVA